MGFTSISCQLLLTAAAVSAKWIVPGARWRDTKGDLVNAHAGGITIDQETGKFFWFGEYKVQGQVEGGGVSVYSSDDLATWEPHGLALKPVAGHPYIDTHHIIQRPKVAYSEGTGKYHVHKPQTFPSTKLLITRRCGGTQIIPHTAGCYKALRNLIILLDRIAL
jgi:hypothetical protein